MMITIFVVCYSVLIFATAVYIYAVFLKKGLLSQLNFEQNLVICSILWPLFWLFMFYIFTFNLCKRYIKLFGKKLSEHL